MQSTLHKRTKARKQPFTMGGECKGFNTSLSDQQSKIVCMTSLYGLGFGSTDRL